MFYKAKHKRKWNYKNIINRRFLVLLLSLIIISVTVTTSYAYFVGELNWLSLNGDLNKLSISNGSVNFDVDYEKSTWKNAKGDIITEVSNPQNNAEVTYGPVWVEQKGENKLTSKVDLLSEYRLDKEGGSEEVARLEVDNGLDTIIAEPFEVIVGDIDNFGYAEKGDPYTNSSSNHNLNVFPSSYDSKGTDRRMVGSGFYDKLSENYGKTQGFYAVDKYQYYGILNSSMNYDQAVYYGHKTYKNYMLPNGIYNDYFLYDGYTDRTIRGAAGGSYHDGKDWTFLQKSEPLKFTYNKVEKDIKSVTFQVFTDDIQSQLAGNRNASDFGQASGSVFNVYINGVEIPEFRSILNKISQSGPKGNIVTLHLPEKYFYLIKNSSGLDKGLSFLIDDKNGWNLWKDYYTGDSFAIDFAKMTVNAQATGSEANEYFGTVGGYVKDASGNPIEGVEVVTGAGETAVTSSTGYFSIRTYKGTVKLTMKKDKYKTKVEYFKTDIDSALNIVTLNYDAIIMQEKYQVEIIATKCDLDGNPILDENGEEIKIIKRSSDLNDESYYLRESGTIVSEAINLKFEPDSKYKLEYKLILKDRASLKDIQDFNIDFTLSSIKIKASQENNSGWAGTGTGENYYTTFNNIEVNKDLPEIGDEIVKETDSKGTTEIYFELPDTNYWQGISNTSFFVNGNLLTETEGQKVDLGTFYKFEANRFGLIDGTLNSNKGSRILVQGGSGQTTGSLYWFTTQKVFICTN